MWASKVGESTLGSASRLHLSPLSWLGNSSSLLQSSPNPHAGAHASINMHVINNTASCKIGIPNSTETRQAAAAHLPPLPQSLSNAHPNVHHCSRCGGNSVPCLQFVLRAEDGFIHVYQRLAHREAVFYFAASRNTGAIRSTSCRRAAVCRSTALSVRTCIAAHSPHDCMSPRGLAAHAHHQGLCVPHSSAACCTDAICALTSALCNLSADV